nr:SCO family protein [Bacteriovorax sp. HI3]
MNKEMLKNIVLTFLLMSVFIFSYLYMKKDRDYHALSQLVQTPTGERRFSDIINGKPSLIYFGFLNCPDACPTTFSMMSRVFKELEPGDLDKFNFIFVDLDPERDSMERLVSYSSYFHPKIFPVVVPLKDLDAFTRFFGIAFMKVKLESSMSYTIDHSVDVVVLSKEGKFLELLHHDAPKTVVLKRIKDLIN